MHPGIQFLIISVFLLILPFGSAAVVNAQNNSESFEHISIEQGLSQSSINSIIQDYKGYMWIATADGLDRYDGYSFKVFRNNPEQPSSLSDNSVVSLFEDKSGNLWAGTLLGTLNRFDRKTEQFLKYNLSSDSGYTNLEMNIMPEYPLTFARFNDRTITAIIGDKKGILWIGTWGQGLFRFDPANGNVKRYKHNPSDPNSLSNDRIVSLLEDRNGILWIGTFGGGLNRAESIYNGSSQQGTLQFTRFQNIPALNSSLSDNRVISLALDIDGNLWAATFGGGLNKLANNFLSSKNKSAVKFVRYMNNPANKNSLSNNWTMKIIQDKLGYLWIATFGGGLNKFNVNSGTFTIYRNIPLNPNSLSDNDIISLCEDRTGIIWIGTHLGKGINRFDRSRNKFTHYSYIPGNANSLSDNVVWTFSEDNSGHIWIGTYRGGLNKFDKAARKFVSYKHDPAVSSSISSNHIRSVLADRSGNIWVGTYNAGLNLFSSRTGKSRRFLNNPSDSASISGNQVISIFEDRTGTLWVGTFGGGLDKVMRNNGNISFIHYRNNPADPKSLSDNRIYKIYEDRSGNLWIGTFGGGLSRFDQSSGTFINYRNNPADTYSLSDNRVISIYEDRAGTLWIGTYGGGLNRFDTKTGKFYKYIQDKSHSSVVYGILEDNNHNLWISSDNGLSRFNPATATFVNYDLHDGLQSMEFSGGAYYKTRSGEMYFGGINGFNCFYPDSISENTHIPPVVISAFRIFNRQIDGESSDIVLSNKDNFFSFEFAALDYTNSEQNRYAYKLDGFDNDWHYTDASRRLANYTNLDPGKYVFRVKGSNNDGIWNDQGIEVRITILPPFWRTWWFIAMTVILLGGTLTFFTVSRVRQLLAIERLKTKLAADLHDNIGSGLTEISILSQVIANELNRNHNTEEVKQKLQNINETSGQLIDNMSDIVWVVNPRRDTLYDLILRLKDSYSEIFSSLGVSFRVNDLEMLHSVKLPMEYRQNLYLIFKESINNSLKHSNCQKITLDTILNGRKLELMLKDDGRGFDMANSSPGNGLRNIKRRAKSLGGQLTIESACGKGTSIRFLGKIPRTNLIFTKHKE